MVSRSELATRLARGGASHAQAAHAVDAVLHEITAALVAGERVALTGFGTFEPVARPERTARNPRTGAAVQVPAATVARFHAGTALRGALAAHDAGPAPTGVLPVSRTGGAAATTSSPVVPAGDVVPALEVLATGPGAPGSQGSAKGAKPAKSGKKLKSGKKVKQVAPTSKKGAGTSGKKSKGKR